MAEAQRSQADLLTVWPTQITQTWQQVREGFAKNILAGHGNHLTFLLFSIFFHNWLFVFPSILLTRALTAATSRQRTMDALLMPISVLLMTMIALQSIYWRYNGGPHWKGRTLPTP